VHGLAHHQPRAAEQRGRLGHRRRPHGRGHPRRRRGHRDGGQHGGGVPGQQPAARRRGAGQPRLGGAGVEVTWDQEMPGSERFYASDPWGNRLEFTAV
jgi:hypothetical protein